MVNKELQIDEGRIAKRSDAEGAEDGTARKNGKAIGMVGWGHLCLPFLCGREVEVRPGFFRGPAALVNSGECAVPVKGDGSPILPGGEPRRMQRTREARELEREYMTARC